MFIAFILYNRAWKRIRVVYGFSFNSCSSHLYSSLYWSRLKMTFLRCAVFFSFTGDIWSMSSLYFDGIWSSHVGSLGSTFRLNKRTILFSFYVRLLHVLLSTVTKSPLNLISYLVSILSSLVSFWRWVLFLGILSSDNHLWPSVVIYFSAFYHLTFSWLFIFPGFSHLWKHPLVIHNFFAEFVMSSGNLDLWSR